MVAIGAAALAGWFAGSVVLKGIGAGYIPMAPNTALVFILIGAVLLILVRNSRRVTFLARSGITVAIILILARLSEYVTGIDLKVDRWIFSFPVERLGLAPIGKMALFTALNFLVLVGACFLSTFSDRCWARDAAKALAIIVGFTGSAFALGYIYGAPLMYGGRSIPMALNTAIAFFICGIGLLVRTSVIDLIERQRVNEALRESEERYRLLFENNPYPTWVVDEKTLAFFAVNQAAIISYGYSLSEFLAMTLKDICPSDEVLFVFEKVSNAYARVEETTRKHCRKDGSVIDVEITSHPLIFAGKSARVVLANDVTERKHAEDAIKELNTNLEQRSVLLEQANKDLESFSYSVSHDLRAPLRAIDGFSHILLDDCADKLDAEGVRVLEVIRSNTRNMSRLIDDLLAFSRLGRKPIERSEIDMAHLVDDVFVHLDPVSPAQTLRFNVETLPPTHGDAALIRQVWMNLLSNALKYSRKTKAPTVNVGSYAQNGDNVYFVKDNGAGFDMKYADKLFGVFQRLHKAEDFEGTGVGLAIVQRIIQRHNGRIWAEAQVNEGATFFFSLPKERMNQNE